MRILHIGQYHEVVGGAEVLREQVLLGLEARGHENAFFGGSEHGSIRSGRRHVVRRPGYDPETLVRDGRFQLELDRFLAKFQPEVVHLHQVGGLPVDLYAQLGETGLPLVETVYDYGHFCPNSWSVHADGKPCESGAGAECFRHRCHENYPFHAGTVWTTAARLKYVREWVDVMICPTRDLVRRFGESGFRDVQLQTYYPSTADLEPQPIADRTSGRLLVIARLVREKGVDHALEAFARFAQERPDASLHVVGEGPERTELERLASRLGVGKQVRFLGHLDLPRTHVQMRQAQALLVPSIWMEALPLITFDADALGLPIVAHAIGGLPGAVDPGRNGLLVQPGNPEAFASAIREVVTGPQAQAHFASRGPERVAGCGPERYLDGLERAYLRAREQAASRAPGPRGSIDLDERVLLDRVMRHAGSLEKAIAIRGPSLRRPIAKLRRKVSFTLRKAFERFSSETFRPPGPQALDQTSTDRGAAAGSKRAPSADLDDRRGA